MPTVTLNRTTKVLRVDLADSEFVALDPYILASGTIGVEQVLVSFINSIRQAGRERALKNIRERIEALSDAKRDAILAVIEAP